MSFSSPLRYAVLLVALLVSASSVAAQTDLGPQSGLLALSSSSQLNLTATALNAIQIDISTAPGGATVTGGTETASTGVFALNLGEVNGFGLGTPSPGVSVSVQAGGALYSTPITLTPRFSGFSTGAATVTVRQDLTAGNLAGQLAAREGSSTGAMTSVVPATVGVVTISASSGTPITRYVGMFVSNLSGVTAVGGSLESRLIYQITP